MIHPDPSMSTALFAAVWDARSAALGLVARALAPEPDDDDVLPPCQDCGYTAMVYVGGRFRCLICGADTTQTIRAAAARDEEPADCPDGAFVYTPGRAWVD